MEAFRGNHPAKVEEGGRLKLPGPFKRLLDEAAVTQFYITSIDGLSDLAAAGLGKAGSALG
jgi:MraZ protein